MSLAPNLPSVSLADAEQRYKDAVAVIFDTYRTLEPKPRDQVTPQQLDAGVVQFFRMSTELDRGGTAGARLDTDEVSRLGDYGMSLLMDLAGWAQRLGLGDLEAEFDAIALSFADWIVRHGGEIRTIESVVDALANQANHERDPLTLEWLTHLTTRIIRSTAPAARLAMKHTLPNPPWCVLNLNYGIVATRTRNPALMEHAFDELVRNVPNEAPRFFAEGMQQMEKFDFPLPVRAVMTRYFDRWTRPRMN